MKPLKVNRVYSTECYATDFHPTNTLPQQNERTFIVPL